MEQERGLPASELAALCGVDRALVSRVASELMGLGLIREAAPVSYTHLDVYKRQPKGMV